MRFGHVERTTRLALLSRTPPFLHITMSSLSAARTVTRSLRASGLSRLAGPVSHVPTRGLSTVALFPGGCVAPQKMVPCIASRSFTSTPAVFSKDTTWQTKGPVRYTELKPETESPSGDITVIDVREPSEVAQGMIPSAVNVPLSQFEQAFSGKGGDFVRDFAFDRPKYDSKIIFYCRSGKRSQQAVEFAQKNGWWK